MTSVKQSPWQGVGSEIRVVSFNVLFDLYFPELIHTQERMTALFGLLQQADADIIALQEVTPGFLATILSEDWVQQTYCSSSQPGSAQVEPYGQLLLSRIPIEELDLLQLTSSSKTILIARMPVGDHSLVFSTLHLTSNHAQNNTGPLKRERQLKELEKTLRHYEGPGTQLIIAGDFNASEDDPGEKLVGFVDLWPQFVEPQADGQIPEGHTFDPRANPLAKLNSITGLPHRLDRIYVKNSTAIAAPSTISLLGTEPVVPIKKGEVLHVSDHYGLLAVFNLPAKDDTSQAENSVSQEEEEGELENDTASSKQPTPHTCIMIIPPHETWDQIEAIRSKYMTPTAMPHVTTLFRFWPEAHFPEAVGMLERELENWEPFDVTLRDFDVFSHQHTCTVWAKPESDRIIPFQVAIQKLFPECDEVTKRSREFFFLLLFFSFCFLCFCVFCVCFQLSALFCYV